MNRAATIALAPLSLAYGAAVKLRSALYRKRVFKTHGVSVPVISVGNITTGGTGKTPLVEWIARKLAEREQRVCILTRGYRRANPTERVLVSDGQQIVADIDQAGDEALMLARALLHKAAVVCDADRVAGARWVIANLKPQVLILDDGFQHVRLARDLDIVTIDSTKPWGNGRLFPSGTLRESVEGLKRAGCIVVTRATGDADSRLADQISQASDAPIFRATTVIDKITALGSGDFKSKDALARIPIAAFCGIGNPKAFFRQLRDEGFDVRHTKAFLDHHKYTQTDVDRLTQRSVESGAQALLTTAKDAVKLASIQFTLPCYVVEIETKISEADALLALIEDAIRRKGTTSPRL